MGVHRIYHGKVARIFDVRNRAVGIEVALRSREKQIRKRLYVRMEHCVPWKGREEYLQRSIVNKARILAAKAKGIVIPAEELKRQPPVITRPGGNTKIPMSDVVEVKCIAFEENIY